MLMTKSDWLPIKFEGILTRIFWPKLGDLMYSCLRFGTSEGVPDTLGTSPGYGPAKKKKKKKKKL